VVRTLDLRSQSHWFDVVGRVAIKWLLVLLPTQMSDCRRQVNHVSIWPTPSST